jgi:hypothetical protein
VAGVRCDEHGLVREEVKLEVCCSEIIRRPIVKIGRHFSFAGLSVGPGNGCRCFRYRLPAKRTVANVGEGSFEENFSDGDAHVGPNLIKVGVDIFGTWNAAFGIALRIRYFDKAAVDDLEDFPDGDFLGSSREKITTVDATLAYKNSAAFEFKEDLFEIFYWNSVALSDLMNGDNFWIFQGEMKNRARCIFAFGRNSHGLVRVDFHRATHVSN